jgi:hypothetical protein
LQSAPGSREVTVLSSFTSSIVPSPAPTIILPSRSPGNKCRAVTPRTSTGIQKPYCSR